MMHQSDEAKSATGARSLGKELLGGGHLNLGQW